MGLALLVVLDKLTPAERIAFVLHDMFDVSFDEIAVIVGRTPAAARQLASRARRRVQGAETPRAAELSEQRRVVDAFLAALRRGDFEGLMAVLDPEVVVHIDAFAGAAGGPREIHGAEAWARGAVAFAQLAQTVDTAMVDGNVGLIWAPQGSIARAVTFTIANGKVVEAEIIADPARLGGFRVTLLDKVSD